ncbi:MAG: tol-pal system-associated acyl-CoA thioesterase [Thiobacillaceae bacterium]|nr:tol-pal system-associated acyl-CoA thioesterase [Thiobacillaceae bacterium]MCX7672891.1 tol-pal system-associated acyl-CoA thioesterase [Thiobacillaceae bacterium]MDW8324281.1 tol-pal system-associated acyl-CoA thioesterase [Burkholderiales bacterium]
MDTTRAFTWTVRVYWEDTDAGGVVYYANYLKFLERARTEWLRAMELDQRRLAEEDGVLFVVRHVALEFLAPARLDDLLAIKSVPEELGGASLTLQQEIQRADGRLLLTARVRIVCVRHHDFKPTRIPAHVVRRIHACTHTAS